MLVQGGHEGVNQWCPLIAQLDDVTSVDFANSDIDDGGFAHLCKLRELRCLSFWGNRITLEGTSCAKAWDKLVRLQFSSRSAKGFLSVFAALPNLEVLDSQNCELSENDLASLAQYKTLRELRLCMNPIERGLRYAAACKQLRVLDLSSTELTLDGVKELAFLDNLSSLTLNHCPIDDEMCIALGDVGALRELKLGQTHLTSRASIVLRKLHRLTTLLWPSAAIDLGNIDDFAQLPYLRTLIVPDDPRPSVLVANALREALPNCDVDIW